MSCECKFFSPLKIVIHFGTIWFGSQKHINAATKLYFDCTLLFSSKNFKQSVH